MVSYRVLSWQGIPSQVTVTAADGTTIRRQLPPSFQQEIDRVAMAEGLIDSDAYLELWEWSDLAEREGSAEEVAESIVAELAEGWQQQDGATREPRP